MRLLLRLRTLEVTRAGLLEASYEIGTGFKVPTMSGRLAARGASIVCNRAFIFKHRLKRPAY